MNQVTVNRTPDLIAAEINNIKNQTRKIVLYNSIEIGRRLTEAKTLISHGEWGKWLEESVDYSQSTANNLMRIFQEYGADQISLLGDAKSQAFGNLSYSQAVALLGVPKDEREQFIEENDVENMSTRELQKAIKEKEEAEKKLETANQIANEKSEEAKKLMEEKQKVNEDLKKLQDELKEEKEKSKKEIEELQKSILNKKKELQQAQDAGDKEEIETIQQSLIEKENELENSKQKIEELEKQLQERPVEVNAETIVEKIPEEIEKELNELRKKASQSNDNSKTKVEFSVHFKVLVKNFNDLLGSLEEIKASEGQEDYEKHKNAVIKLIDKMKENL